MNVLFIIINKPEHLEDLLSKLMEVGIKGATILESQGMGFAVNHGGHANQPFYGQIRSMIDNSRPYNKTIFTIIEDEELLEKAVNTVKEIVGDLNKLGVGVMFTVPIGKVYGM